VLSSVFCCSSPFQQDGARAHTARDTIAYLEVHVPDFMEPDIWPSNFPDLNPVDYCVWGILENMVYKTKIRNRDHLRQVLEECWESFPQDSIDKAIDQFRPRLRKVIEVEGKHTVQLF
jgi:hypothetical protein